MGICDIESFLDSWLSARIPEVKKAKKLQRKMKDEITFLELETIMKSTPAL